VSTRGELKLRGGCFPAFDCAQVAPEVKMRHESVVFRGGDLALELAASIPLRREERY